MIQKLLIKLALPIVLDVVIAICEKLATRSTNTIDDNFVKSLRENKVEIIAGLSLL